MQTTHAAQLEVFRTAEGCLIRVVGRGTMRESRVFHDYARRCLEAVAEDGVDPREPLVVIDLSECERLDSTFLGCLVDLHKRFNRGGAAPFAVAAPPEVAAELLRCSRLDRLLPLCRETPTTAGDGAPLLTESAVDARDLGRHVMECHRRLAEQGGPMGEAFARVADQLERELMDLDRTRGVIE
ncbi:MAG: STAS domain-containing protein [Planctomycetes bacterium]|nr:STAS domain-containing protein [Planctomycetota bacterium]